MSGFIPIVSSSPPPLDENAINNNDEDDWDDFAQFTAAPEPAIEDGVSSEQFFSPIEPPDVAHQNSANCEESEDHITFGAFADCVESSQDDSSCGKPCSAKSKDTCLSCVDSGDFASFQDGSSVGVMTELTADRTEPCDASDRTRPCFSQQRETESPLSAPEVCSLAKDLHSSGHQTGCRSDAPDIASQGSATDSGLSTDVSPSAKMADVNDDFATKTEHVVDLHVNGEDSGTEDQTPAFNNNNVLPPMATSVSAHNSSDGHVNGDLANTEGRQSPILGVSSGDNLGEAKDCSGSAKGVHGAGLESSECSSTVTLTCDGDSGVDPTVCDTAETVPRDNCSEGHVVATMEFIHRLDAGGDTTDRVDARSLSSNDGASVSGDVDEVPPGFIESQEEFTEFRDVSPANPCDQDNSKNYDPELDDFHFKQSVMVGDEDSPVESLDLKLPAMDAGTPQGDGDEWADDFTEFKEAGPPHDETTEAVTSEWAAFENALPADDGNDNWASFNDVKATGSSNTVDTSDQQPASNNNHDSDDDFGDFEDVPTESFQVFVSSMANILQTIGNINHIKKIVSNAFNDHVTGSTEHANIQMLLEFMEKAKLESSCSEERASPKHSDGMNVCVWNNLKDVSNTAALKYTWNNSANRQKLLQACSIDTRNILLGHKKPSVPIFYQQTVLEPSRGPPEPNKSTTPSPASSDSLTPDVKTVPTTNQNVVVVSTASSSLTPPAATSQDIPPAEFDWSSSGLTNPLDALQQEQEILQALESPSGAKPEPPKTLQSIETLLAGLKFTPTAPLAITKKEETVSQEAQQILDKLPDLSFMNASVLMFPLKVNSEQSD